MVLPMIPFTRYAGEATRHFGELRTCLAAAGTPIGPYDLQIAAIALTHDLTVVTRNVREFGRVPSLRIENWIDGAES
jgi:tRNA(fMet)-specific endonuclease VapC